MVKIFAKEMKKQEKSIYMMTLNELQAKFEVDVTKGLSSTKANDLLTKKRKDQISVSYSRIFKAVFLGLFDYFSLLCWIGLIVSLVLALFIGDGNGRVPDTYDLINFALILMSLAVRSVINGLHEYRLTKSLKNLQPPNTTIVSVLRDSTWHKIPAHDLVIGDVVEITANHYVPVDLRIISANCLRFDKSILTGETEAVEASVNHFERGESIHGYLDASNIALTNFWVISGHGNGLVIPTENHSIQFINEITKRMTRFSSNPIGRALNQIALGVFVMSMMCEIIYLVVWVCYLRTIHTYTFTQVLSNLLHIFLTGVPFGLPMSLNFGLLFLVRYLGKLHILVKNMFSLATMSSIDVVLTDKTGTLTHNVYEVSDLFFGNGELDVEMNLQSANISEGLKKLLDLCDFCSIETEIDRIDQTLCRFAQRNRPFESLNLRDFYDIIDEIAFTSTNMYQARLIQVKEEKEDVLYKESNALGIKSPSVLIIRGMPEFILPKCRYMLRADSGEKMKMKETNMKTIESTIAEWSAMGHRIICFAKKVITEEAMEKRSEENYDFPKWFNVECNRLVFAGMIGFMDHPKPCINDTVEKIREMGIKVVMVTGDYSITAASIAVQVGIFSSMNYDTLTRFRQNVSNNNSNRNHSKHINHSSILLDGKDIYNLSLQEIENIYSRYSEIVISRAKPIDKVNIIKKLQSNGHSVLMVGDGVNDVAALKQANQSVAMASGSKLASDAANFILLNSAFSSIHELISTGRKVFLNAKKVFLYVLISSVFSQYVVVLLARLLGTPKIYSDLQMIVLCTVFDILPAMSLLFENPDPVDLNQRPISNIINRKLLGLGFLFIGPITTFFVCLNYYIYFRFYSNIYMHYILFSYFTDDDEISNSQVVIAQTICFYSIVVIQVFGNLYSIRTRRLPIFESMPIIKPYRNLFLVGSTVLTFFAIAGFVSIPIPGVVSQIPIAFYGYPLVCAAIMLLINEIRKTALSYFTFLQDYFTW